MLVANLLGSRLESLEKSRLLRDESDQTGSWRMREVFNVVQARPKTDQRTRKA